LSTSSSGQAVVGYSLPKGLSGSDPPSIFIILAFDQIQNEEGQKLKENEKDDEEHAEGHSQQNGLDGIGEKPVTALNQNYRAENEKED